VRKTKHNILNNDNKIIFVHFNNGFTGSPMVLKTVIDSVIDKQSVLITNKNEGFLSNISIPTITFNFTLSSSKLITLYNYFSAQIIIFFNVLKICKKNDLLYINTTIPMFASFAGRIKGAKIIFHLHEDRSSLNFVHKLLSSFRKYFCDIEIFVSKYLKQQEHIDGFKNFILHNVVPISFFEEGIKYQTLRKGDNVFNVLMICSLKKYKGVFEFLKIAEKLISINEIKFTLIVSEESEEINKFFNEIQIPKNVTIQEITNNTIPFYKKASLLLNLSRPDEWIETYGLTILEAMTFGLPCIVPPIGGPIELIDDGINGYKISSYEIDNISEKIISLYNDKHLYELMSNNNKERAAKYHINTFQKKINQIIDDAFQNN
jgi:glycosyltransferase involved in cell wall biosynthesis